MKKISEDNIQAQAYRFFTNEYCMLKHTPRRLMFSVPNEIGAKLARSSKDAKRVYSQMQCTGLLEGVSDTIIVSDNKVYFVEFKTMEGYQRASQKEFEKRVSDLGHTYVLIRSFEQFKEFCRNEFN